MIRKHYPILLFVIGYIVFGLLIYKSLPITNDEQYRYSRGKELLNHFTRSGFNQFALFDQPNADNFIYSGYALVLNIFNPNFYYEHFHLLNYLFAFPLFLTTYVFMYLYSKNTYVSIGTVGVLIAFPSFFGHVGINPADIPFALLYLLALLVMRVFLPVENKIYRLLILGVVIGIAQSLRQVGLSLYLILVIYDLYLSGWKINNLQAKIWEFLVVFIVANFIMVITWPNFAINYFRNLFLYVSLGKNYLLWDHKLLFLGEFLDKYQRPFYYLPLLQLITYPIYILPFFTYALVFCKKLFRDKSYFLLITAILVNYLMYFVLNPVLYDGIRHYLFIIPPIVILSAMAFTELIKLRKNIAVICLVLVIFGILNGFYRTYSMFPYHYMYFNHIAKIFGNPYQMFDTDYFSTTYTQASKWIRDFYPKTNSLKIYACDASFTVDYYSYKSFVTTIDRSSADLIICDYKNLLNRGYQGEALYQVTVGGNVVNTVLKPLN